MSIYVKTKAKYGSDIASYLDGIVVFLSYDCWTFEQKTRKARENSFNKLFNGPKENYKPDHPLCFN